MWWKKCCLNPLMGFKLFFYFIWQIKASNDPLFLNLRSNGWVDINEKYHTNEGFVLNGDKWYQMSMVLWEQVTNRSLGDGVSGGITGEVFPGEVRHGLRTEKRVRVIWMGGWALTTCLQEVHAKALWKNKLSAFKERWDCTAVALGKKIQWW